VLLEFSIGKSHYQLNCEEAEKEKLLHLADKLNQRVNSLSFKMKNADDKTLLMIAALTIEEELEKRNEADEDDEIPKLNEQDMYDAVSENMENVSDYIEKLTRKIQNY